MRRSLARWVAALAFVCTAGCQSPATPGAAPALQLEPCRLRGASELTSIAAECGTLRVPEDPRSGDALIELFVARVPSLAPAAGDIAFTILAGGPGQAATEFYADYAPVFEPLQRQRDVLLVDQRGTGRSNRLDCEYDTSALEFSPAAAATAAADCLRALPHDPRYYTSSLAVGDLDRVREALGYERLDIYGASYGTRVGLHYLRRYPQHTRTLTLDGVIAADQLVGPDIALVAQDALDEIFGRCSGDAGCSSRYPGLEERFARIQQTLRAAPVAVQMPHPVSGERTDVDLDYNAFAGAVRLLSYTPATASLLPLLLHEADAGGNWAPLAAQAQMTLASLADALAEGMHNAVVCTEDVPFFAIEPAQRERLRGTYLGELLVDALHAICEVWPAGVIDADFHTPVVADTPVLLLSGSADPVTPPANAERAAATLANSLHVVAAGHGHGVIGLPCVPQLLADFVEHAAFDALDRDCVDGKRPAPFFSGFSGPEP